MRLSFFMLIASAALILSACADSSVRREYDLALQGGSAPTYNFVYLNIQAEGIESVADTQSENRTDPTGSFGLEGGTAAATKEGVTWLEDILSYFKGMSDNLEDNSDNSQEGSVNPIEAPVPEEGMSEEIGETIEELYYHGRYNGDRPTWYGDMNMADYGAPFLVEIPGCNTWLVEENDGVRLESDEYIVKQSDVEKRGLAVVAPSSCMSREARVLWDQGGEDAETE